MSITKLENPALILIDIQKGFNDVSYWGGDRNNVNAEQKAGELLEIWRAKKLPIFHIQHFSSNPNSILNETNPGNEFQDVVKPIEGETIIKKNVNSAFIGTNLKELLDEAKITTFRKYFTVWYITLHNQSLFGVDKHCLIVQKIA